MSAQKPLLDPNQSQGTHVELSDGRDCILRGKLPLGVRVTVRLAQGEPEKPYWLVTYEDHKSVRELRSALSSVAIAPHWWHGTTHCPYCNRGASQEQGAATCTSSCADRTSTGHGRLLVGGISSFFSHPCLRKPLLRPCCGFCLDNS